MTGDTAVLVPEQSFPVFLGHSSGAQPSAESMLEVMDADSQKAVMCWPQVLFLPLLRRPDPRLLPARVIHAVHSRLIPFANWLAKRKHEQRVLSALPLKYRLDHVVHHHQALIPVFHASPIPLKLAYLLLPASRVDLKHRHDLQVRGQFGEQDRLLFPRKRLPTLLAFDDDTLAPSGTGSS